MAKKLSSGMANSLSLCYHKIYFFNKENGKNGRNKCKEKEQKEWYFSLIITLVFIGIAAVYAYIQNAAVPVISIDGVEFKLKQKASVLIDAGFEITGGTELASKTWDSSYEVKKNGVTYGYVTLYNKTSSTQPLSECRIGEFYTYKFSTIAYDKVMVNGIPIIGIKKSEVKDKFGVKEDDTVVSTSKGYTNIMFSDYDSTTDTYNKVNLYCEFGKSYK